MRGGSIFLGGDPLGEIREVEPPLHLFLQGGLVGLLLLRQVLKLAVVAAAGQHLPLPLGDAGLQGSDVGLDGVVLPLFLEGKLQLFLPGGLAGGLLLRLLLLGGGGCGLAFVQVVGVVAAVPGDLAFLPHLEDLVGHLVQKVPVMGHRQHRPGEGLQVLLQNGQGGDVQVIGGLVQQQDVGSLHQQGEEVQPPPLPAGELPDGLALELGGEEESLHHLGGGEVPLPGLHLAGHLVDEVVHPLAGVQLPPLLGEVADAHRLPPVHGAGIRGELAGDEI